jgi:surface protein
MKNWLKNLMVGLALISPSYCFAEIASGTSGTCKWTISDSGLLTVEPASGNEGTLATWSDASLVPWRPYMESIKKVVVKNYVKALTCAGMFSGGINIESIDLKGLDVNDAVSMEDMFSECAAPSLDLRGFLTASCTNMKRMFYGAKCKTLDLSTFDTYFVTDMSGMFEKCAASTIDIHNFFTVNVTDMSSMFSGCESLSSLDISVFNTKNVTDMTQMFSECVSLTELNLTNFVTTNAATESMFKCDDKLTTIISNAETPSLIKDDTFSSLPTLGKCELACPSASESNYKEADGWKLLFQTATGIDFASADAGNSLDASSRIYDINGNRLSATSLGQLPSGLYIINGKKVVK